MTDCNNRVRLVERLKVATGGFLLLVTVLSQVKVLGQQGPVLPLQVTRNVNELTTLVVTNTAVETNTTSGRQFGAVLVTNRLSFAYAERNALLGNGWSFMATTPAVINGVATTYQRNTEITDSANGFVADYNQSAHPGYINIPCDQGDLWANLNSTRNFLWRALPTNWTTIDLAVTFSPIPSLNYQQAHLVLYQDDDNFVQVGFSHNDQTAATHDPTNGPANNYDIETMIWEAGGYPQHEVQAYSLTGNMLELRFDRDVTSGNVQGRWSLNGLDFRDVGPAAAVGAAYAQLVNPRLGLWTGGAPAGGEGAATLTLRGLVLVTSVTAPAFSYRLLNAPAGASIDGNGIITWTPSQTQSPGTNVFTTVVTDNGLPPLSATNSFTVVVQQVKPVLPNLPDRSVSALSTLVVTNTATETGLTVNAIGTNTIVFSYSSRTELLADGWSFVGAGGRNTEITFGAGVVDYNQMAHPGGLNIPCDQGDLYGPQFNNTHNSLFRALPADWRSVRLALTFAPVTADYQQAHLCLYQDDDNYQQIGVGFSSSDGNERLTLDTELGGVATTPAKAPTTRTSLNFRLDRNSTNGAVTAYYSFDGANWTLLGTMNPVLPNPRLMIWTGGSQVPYASGMAMMGLQRLDLVGLTSVPAVLNYSLVNAPGGASLDANGIIIWQPSLSDGPGPFIFTTVVTDNGLPARSATNSFLVTVTAPRNGPSLPALADLTVAQYATLRVTNTATDTDIPFLGLTYTLASAPVGVSIDTNGVIAWTPGPGQGRTTNTITTLVADGGIPQMRTTNSFVVVVNEMNVAPVLPVQTVQVLTGRQSLYVTNTASAPYMPPVTLNYQLLGPAGAAIDDNGLIAWTPSVAQVPSTNLFTTIVTAYNPWAVNAQRLSATNTFTVMVNPVHNGPVLPGQGDQTVAQYSRLVVTNTASDSDLPVLGLIYSLVNPPTGGTIDTNGVISWTPGAGQGHTTNTVTTIATDIGTPALSATNRFSVVVTEVNVAPVLPNQGNRVLAGAQALVVTNTATAPDMPPVTLTYELSAPSGAVIDANGIIHWTPSVGQVPSTNVFTTVVTDFNHWAVNSQRLSATNSFTVVVNVTHNGPVLAVKPDVTIAQYSLLTVTNTASDADLPPLNLRYTLANPPPGASIDSSGVIRWTPGPGQGHSTNFFTTIVTDSGTPALSATNSFVVVVHEINVPPTLGTPANRTLAGRQTLIVTNTASAMDMPPVTLSYQLTGPAGAVIDANGVITWTPSLAQVPSTNLFTTVVTANNPWAVNAQQLSATNIFTVTTTYAHNGPFLPAQTNRVLNELTTLTVTNTAGSIDVPLLPVTYRLAAAAPTGALVDTNGVITWTPTEAQGPSTNVITTVAMDAGTPPLSATNSFAVVVNEVNSPPVLLAQADQALSGLQSLVVTNGASDADSPANRLSYSFLSAPAGAVIDANGVIAWTPIVAQVPGSYLFRTVATDSNPWAVNSQQLSATNSFTVVVNAVHNGPLLAARADVTIAKFSTLILTNAAIDTDVPPLGLNYALMSAPAGASIDADGIISWTPTEAQTPSTNTFITLVYDNASPPLSAVNTFTVFVSALPKPPTLKAFKLDNGQFTISWDSVPGRSYQVQYTEQLAPANWVNLSGTIQVVGTTVTITNTLGPAPTRCYRVLLLP
jgi:hypothetical protein